MAPVLCIRIQFLEHVSWMPFLHILIMEYTINPTTPFASSKNIGSTRIWKVWKRLWLMHQVRNGHMYINLSSTITNGASMHPTSLLWSTFTLWPLISMFIVSLNSWSSTKVLSISLPWSKVPQIWTLYHCPHPILNDRQ